MVRHEDRPPAAARPLIACLFQEKRHRNKWYSGTSCAKALNTIAGPGNEPIDAEFMKRAFKNNLIGDGEVNAIPFSTLGLYPSDHQLCARFQGRNRGINIMIGRFPTKQLAEESLDVHDWCAIPDCYRNELVELIAERRSVAAEKQASKTKIQRPKSANPRSPMRKRGKSAHEHPPQPGPDPNSEKRKADEGRKEADDAVGEDDKSRPNLFYTLFGRAGKLCCGEDGAVSIQDLRDNLEPPNKNETETNRRHRFERGHVLHGFGASQYWVPAGATGIASNHLTRITNQSKMIDRLKNLFKGMQCRFSDEAMRILTIFNLHNMGGSDEATEAIIFATVKAVLYEIGLDVSNEKVAHGCPSRRTIARWEARLAVEVIFSVVAEIKKDDPKWLSMQLDHGNRNGIDHLVKIVSWAGYDEVTAERVIKFFCLDVNKSDKTALGAAAAVKESLDVLKAAGLDGENELMYESLTADNGGGAGREILQPKLMDVGALAEHSRGNNCGYHGENKAWENGSKAAFGEEGLGNKNIFQLGYQALTLVKKLKEDVGRVGLDRIRLNLLKFLGKNDRLQVELANSNHKALERLLEKISKDMPNPDGVNATDLLESLNSISEAPLTDFTKNVKDMTFSRWATTNQGIKIVIECWVEIYCLALAVKQSEKSNSYLHKVACDLLSLMNTKTKRDPHSEEPALSALALPPLYIEGLFLIGFTEAFFDHHFEFLSLPDPEFGNSSGQTMRLYVEHVAIMHEELKDLITNYRDRDEFKDFVEAVNVLPESGDENNGDRTFFNSAVEIFFAKYRATLDKHLFGPVRHESLLVYLVGGNSSVAIQFLKWLKHCEENDGDMDDFQFSDEDVTLMHHGSHYTDGAKANLKIMLEFLVADADPSKILKDPLITSNKVLLWQMVDDEDELEFDLWDENTWTNCYDPIVDMVHKRIAIHPIHQQRCENHVQMAALVASTSVNEVRRTSRCIALSGILRPFHQAALKEANEIRAIENEWLESQNKEKKAGEVDRVAGSLRMMLLGDYVDAYSEKVEDTMADVPDEMLRKVFDLVTNKNSKISAKMVDEKVKRYKESMEKKPRKVTKSEINEDGIDIPPEVKGGLKRKFLVKRYEPQIDAEIIFREIKVPLINQVTEDEEEINYQRATKKNLMKVGIRDKKRVLLEHELALRSIHNRPGQVLTLGDIKHIKVQSNEMKALIKNLTQT
mmetsp:Transcript_31076/g.74102  ORF Transcript_31076/g.74102 Transcript_31076/m.74102 type:complete len:1200 (+) Transcript_31076:150-3749(+)